MQFLNNNKSEIINEEKLLNLIFRTDLQNLEKTFSKYYQCKFLEIPEKARNAFFYLCRVELDIKTSELADIYEISQHSLSRIIKACNAKMCLNQEYFSYLRNLCITYRKLQNGKHVA